jgi:hypothetical protein
MPRTSNKQRQALIVRLNGDAKMLRIQIKSLEAALRGCQFSLDFAEDKSSRYCDRLRDDIQRFNTWLADLKQKLAVATNAE